MSPKTLTLGTLVRINGSSGDYFSLDVIGGMPVLGKVPPENTPLKVLKTTVQKRFPSAQDGLEFKVIKWKKDVAVEITEING
ncbi:hypothetical protein HY639_01250 [Candidatus Woesearchaeota archaeon]|nr:hypothetical protein [Candidatus Woesearchaeota archaeon]